MSAESIPGSKSAVGEDNPVTGGMGAVRIGVKSLSHASRVLGAQEICDLSVCRNAAGWNALHDCIDPLEEIH